MGRLSTLVAKDLRVALREKSSLWVEAGFTVAGSVLVASAASAGENPWEAASAGLGLLAIFLAVLGGYALFLREAYTGTFEGLRASPVERWMLVLSKLVVSLLLMIVQLGAAAVVIVAFTPGLDPYWPGLLLWLGATAVMMSGVSAYASASLAFAESGSATMILVVLVLGVPYMVQAFGQLVMLMQGVALALPELGFLWLGGLGFSGVAVALGGIILE